MPNFIDVSGKKFGMLTAIEVSGRKNKKILWKCVCECGKESIVSKSNLATGQTKSCGCVGKNKKHGMCGTRVYKIWKDMKKRCDNQNSKEYRYYGGKGVTYCDDWSEFSSFYEWALESGYSDELTIERIDYNGNYEPSNCKWATLKEQANNTSQNVLIEIDGVTKTLQQWADISNVNRSTIKRRYEKGIRGTKLLAKRVSLTEGVKRNGKTS